MNDLDRAQLVEEMDRELCLKHHANRPRRQAVAVRRADGSTEYRCAECDEGLPAHRVEYGLCIECATTAEQRGKHFPRS